MRVAPLIAVLCVGSAHADIPGMPKSSHQWADATPKKVEPPPEPTKREKLLYRSAAICREQVAIKMLRNVDGRDANVDAEKGQIEAHRAALTAVGMKPLACSGDVAQIELCLPTDQERSFVVRSKAGAPRCFRFYAVLRQDPNFNNDYDDEDVRLYLRDRREWDRQQRGE